MPRKNRVHRSADFNPRAGYLGALVASTVLLAACGSGGSGTTQRPAVGSMALFAGNVDGMGSVDGTGPSAWFNAPSSVAADSAGDVYVADTGNHTIRKITAAGVVTTLAGSAGLAGRADGVGAAARFWYPLGVATDSAGNVYVTDNFNHLIRKISPAGAVTTLAGSAGVVGQADGMGSAASFWNPSGIATDGAANIYVADGYALRKVTQAGVVTTVARSGGGVWFSDGVAADGAGNAYATDAFNFTILKIDPSGSVTTLAGSAGVGGQVDGTGSAATFSYPNGIAADAAGNLYVSDGNTIRTITPTGTVSTWAGGARAGYADGTGGAARFNNPSGVATDGAGNVYVADTVNQAIRKAMPGAVVTTLAGSPIMTGSADGAGTAASFKYPFGLATDSVGNIYVADVANSTIRKISAGGTVTTLAGSAGVAGSSDGTGATATFATPLGVATDRAGNVYVADATSETIRKVTPNGVVTTLAGSARVAGSADGTGAAATFTNPAGIAVDAAGNVYVAGNEVIRKITPARAVTTLAGVAGVIGAADGAGAAATFSDPMGVAVDGAGNVYVADTGNCTVRKITPAGVVTTLAGTAGVAGWADGIGAAARFSAPFSVAVDGAGNVFVADILNSTIRKITPAGTVTTVLGQANVAGFAPGSLPGIISHPSGVAVFNTTLYFTENSGIVRADAVEMP